MEGVLDVYQAPPDPRRPLVCLDEAGKELRSDARPPLPLGPGRPRRIDYEYDRAGSANLFLWVAPHLGRRGVLTKPYRTRLEFAEVLRHLADEVFPEAEQITLVLDNLNTHHPRALYHAFPPDEASRLKARFEFVYTPKHASWLNMAELELSVLTRQCLTRRIPDLATLMQEVEAWAATRNARQIGVRWTFTTSDARRKLARLYPVPICDT